MNEFLQQIRNQEEKKRREANRRSHNPHPYYQQQDRYGGKERYRDGNRKREDPRAPEPMLGVVNEIRNLLEAMETHQRKMAEAWTQEAMTRERTALAVEALTVEMKTLAGLVAESAADNRRERTNFIDPETRDVIMNIIRDMRNEGATYGQIARRLEAEQMPTFSGKGRWHAQTVHRICKTESA
jgi:hypothetical protein